MNMFEMYVITRCDVIVTIAMVFAIVSAVAFCLSVFFYIYGKVEEYEEQVKVTKRTAKLSLILLAISTFTIAFVPTTKECFAIAVLPKVINTEDISAIKSEAGEAWELTKQYLKTLIKDKETNDEK